MISIRTIGYNYWWKSKITANFAGIVWQESRSLPLLSVFLRLVLGNFQAQAVGNYVHNVPLGFSRLWVFCFGEFRKKYFVENNISIARAAVKLPRLFLYLDWYIWIFQQGPHYETLTNAEWWWGCILQMCIGMKSFKLFKICHFGWQTLKVLQALTEWMTASGQKIDKKSE